MASLRLPWPLLLLSAVACGGIASSPMEEPATGGSSNGEASTGGRVLHLPDLPYEPKPEPEPECQSYPEYSRECVEPAEWRPLQEHCFTPEELSERCNLARRVVHAEGGAGGAAQQTQPPPSTLGGAAGSTWVACPEVSELEWDHPHQQFNFGVCGSAPVERNGACCYQVFHTYLTI